ncbi:fibrinogen-like protein 1 [Gigantopelta aegis]|uniref:fibrinogen-like protein 1 n=1 Tax=Gigantopelta aegis TaxID=1735272 RepID=UPI001B88DA2F|nr:fibrinogen-like protein 1 [Gigantopelta aegis]
MRVDISDWAGKSAYASYDSLQVDDESNNYTIHVGKYSGNAGNALRPPFKGPNFRHDNKSFSTYDHDNVYNCAKDSTSGFWFHHCYDALPTGPFFGGRYKTAVWSDWRVKKIAMSIRPKGVV